MNFIVVDSNGNNIECDIIGLFSHEDKNLIIYTESSLEKEKDVHASLYKIENNKLKLFPILKSEDWDLVDKYLEEI